jgi:hypothetical protein
LNGARGQAYTAHALEIGVWRSLVASGSAPALGA